MAVRIQFRRGTSAEWTAANTILASAEIGFETDTSKFKIGNGATAWNSLSYASNASSGTVTSVATSSGLTGGPITGFGTIGVDSTVVPLLASENVFTNVQQINALASGKGLIIRANATTPGDVLEATDSASNIYLTISAFGGVSTNLLGAYPGRVSVGTGGSSVIGLVVRGAAAQTANLTEWQNSAGTAGMAVTSASRILINATSTLASAGITVKDVLPIAYQNTDNTTSNMMAWAFARGNTTGNWMYIAHRGDTANGVAALTFLNSSATEIASISQTGNLTAASIIKTGGTSDQFLIADGSTKDSTVVPLLASANVFTNVQQITSPAAGTKGLVIKLAAGQTANAIEVQNSSGTIIASISLEGSFYVTGNGAVSSRYLLNVGNTGAYVDWNLASGSFGVNQRTTTAVGMIVRGAAAQTAALLEFQDSAGAVKSFFRSDGFLRADAGLQFGTLYSNTGKWTVDGGNSFKIVGADAALQPLIVKAAASQTASLQEWQDSTGAVLTSINQLGSLLVSASGSYWSGSSGRIILQSAAVGTLLLTIKGFAGQTANLTSWQDSTATVVAAVRPSGEVEAKTLTMSVATTTTAIDFATEGLKTISIAAATTFTASNYSAGRSVTVKVTCDTTLRNLTFPTGWVFVGTKPASIAASKVGILTITSFGATEADCVAAWAVQA